MVTPILLKRSTTSGNVPSSLAAGEFAQNLPDEMMFYRSSGGAVARFKLPDCERFITSGTVSNTTNLDIALNPATIGVFRAFKILLFDLIGTDDNQGSFRLRLGSSGGLVTGSTAYDFVEDYTTGSPFTTNDGSTGTSSFSMIPITNNQSPSNSRGGHLELYLSTNDPANAVKNFVAWLASDREWFSTNSTYYNMISWGIGQLPTPIALTQLRFFYSLGNISLCKYVVLGLP